MTRPRRRERGRRVLEPRPPEPPHALATYWEQVRAIWEAEDLTWPEARARWREIHRPGGKGIPSRIPEVSRPLVILRASTSAAICPMCRDPLDVEPDPLDHVPCQACGTRYHVDCLAELDGRCGTLGCAAPITKLRGGQGPIVISDRGAATFDRLTQTIDRIIDGGQGEPQSDGLWMIFGILVFTAIAGVVVAILGWFVVP